MFKSDYANFSFPQWYDWSGYFGPWPYSFFKVEIINSRIELLCSINVFHLFILQNLSNLIFNTFRRGPWIIFLECEFSVTLKLRVSTGSKVAGIQSADNIFSVGWLLKKLLNVKLTADNFKIAGLPKAVDIKAPENVEFEVDVSIFF